MTSVLPPAARAWATIEGTLPPFERLTYQVHMPWPSKAVPLAPPVIGPDCTGGRGGRGGGSARRETENGPEGVRQRAPPRRPPMVPHGAPEGAIAVQAGPAPRQRAARP